MCHDGLQLWALDRFDLVAPPKIMSGDRRKNTASGKDIAPLLQAAFGIEGPKAGEFPSTGLQFLEVHEFLIKELLLATPRVTAGLVQEGCNACFQGLDQAVAVSFSQVVASACKLVWDKKGQVLSGKKLKPDALRRLVMVLAGPRRSLEQGTFLKKQKESASGSGSRLSTGSTASSSGGACLESELGALAASYGLPAVPAKANALVPPVGVSDDESPNAPAAMEISSSEEVPSSSAKSKAKASAPQPRKLSGKPSLGAYDANRACMVRTEKGRLYEADMTEGTDGFMYAAYGTNKPEKTEVPILLWKKSMEGKLKRQGEPVLRKPAAAKKAASKAAAAKQPSKLLSACRLL